jgi:predicted Rdx family selenoprotein
VDGTEDEEQVECSFYEHGSNDAHKSARYFSYDRQTQTKSERVYCYKCQKMTTAFWYVFKQRRDHHKESIKDVLLYIEMRFGVALPRDLILAFDPEAFYTFAEGSDQQQKVRDLFIKARQIREVRHDLPAYIGLLQGLLMTGDLKPQTAA